MNDDAPKARLTRVKIGPDERLARVSIWFLGLAILELGQIAIRLLVGLIPAHLHYRDPPFWASIACYAVAAVAFYFLSRGLRRGQALAKALALVEIVAAILGTYVALNTVSIRAGPTSAPPLNALGESWRGAGWPGIVSHLEEFTIAPSGAWHVAHVAAASFAMLVGFVAIWFLSTGRVRVRALHPTAPTIAERIGGYLLAIHLSFHAILTIAALTGLSLKIAGRM